MLTVNIIAVGKIKEKFFIDALNEYSKRLSGFCKFSVTEIKDEPTPQNASAAEAAKIITREGAAILSKLPKDSYIFALCVEGEQYSSENFAAEIAQLQVGGTGSLTFIIGGSLGLSAEVKSRADKRISFSKMTFPHQLMRVILTEQIYRAFKILNNEPYHK